MEKNNFCFKDSPLSKLRVAVCGNLPTACNYLLGLGVVNVDKFNDAVNLREMNYDLILIYAPQGEGLMNTWISSTGEGGQREIPIRLLNEPCCHSALVELSSKLRRIVQDRSGVETA